MLLQISTILEQPVRSMESQGNVGIVKNIVVNPENGQLMALLVKAGFAAKQKILALPDILSIGPGVILVRNDEAISDQDDIVRINDVLKQKIKIIGNTVATQSGSRIGKVNDVLIETQTAMIAKYYVRGSATGFMQSDRIIPASKVVAITQKAIIVRDDFEKVEETEKVAEAEPAGV